MKIGIDVSPIIYQTGVSRYIKNLLINLLKVDKKNNYFCLGYSLRRKNELEAFLRSLKGNFDYKVFSFPPLLGNIIWNRLHVIPVEFLVGNVDVFHSSDWTQPPTKAHKVTTVHDLIPLLYPKLTSRKTVSVHKARFKHVQKEVDRIIVPSVQTKDDLLKFNIKSNKIFVIPEASDPIYKKSTDDDINIVRKKYGISSQYLISVGVGLRKNSERIVEAYTKLRKSNNIQMVFVGEHPKVSKSVEGVIYTGHISDLDLCALYSGSEILVYPSLYEGFGLPILEAFSCETAVVTSSSGSMKEIAEDAAVLVDPYDSFSIKEGIIKAINEKKDLVTKSKKVVNKYSWPDVAVKTVSVYQF